MSVVTVIKRFSTFCHKSRYLASLELDVMSVRLLSDTEGNKKLHPLRRSKATEGEVTAVQECSKTHFSACFGQCSGNNRD